MLTNIENASFYLLKPIDAINEVKESPDKLVEDVISVGGRYVMNEVAVYMKDEDVIATVGTYPDSCIILTDLPRSRCMEIIKLGMQAFDRKTKEAVEANE